MKTIQQIFHDHAAEYLAKYRGSSHERKVLNAICNCRTPAAGQHVFVCPNCKQEHIANSSCGNRHCPICQNDKAAEWVYRQQLKQLPCTYFLTTFTLPHEFHRIACRNLSRQRDRGGLPKRRNIHEFDCRDNVQIARLCD